VNRAQLKKLWKRHQADPEFRLLTNLIIAVLVMVPSKAEDNLQACELADAILKKAGGAGRRDLKRRLVEEGW
jgi:hypothetical protein